MRHIILPNEYLRYLREAKFLTATQREELCGATETSVSKSALHLTDSAAEDFRETFNLRLVEVGFDTDYEPNEEGRVLEELIDIFFVGVMKRS